VKGSAKTVAAVEPATSHENEFFRIELAPGGIKSIFAKSLNKELLRTDKFLGGELYTMESVGNDAGEFAEVQKPSTNA
jgi:alpha-mannosidase